MIDRELKKTIEKYKLEYPIIAILGPRQSGKTTLAKDIFKNYRYVSLENIDYRLYAKEDPRSFLEEFKAPVIFDEIQRVPELFSYLQEILDNNQEAAQYVLTGSQQFLLSSQITQSLAGRIISFILYPFTYSELFLKTPIETVEEFIFNGMYPRIYDKNLNAQKWCETYINTYLERDIKQLINIRDLSMFEKFLKILASYSGQIINYTNISNMLGVSNITVKRWISLLETSGIIFFLNPYYKNFGKRITKSSKLYFIDTGLMINLLGITDIKFLRNSYLYGNIFETFVISDIYKRITHEGTKPNLYFWQDKQKREIDLLVELNNGKILPIEVKASKTYNSSFANNIKIWQKLSDTESQIGVVVYNGEDNIGSSNKIKVKSIRSLLSKKDNFLD